MITEGDIVVMNDKYVVPDEYKNKQFTVTTEPREICGAMSVWLEGFKGCYAVDGLSKAGRVDGNDAE